MFLPAVFCPLLSSEFPAPVSPPPSAATSAFWDCGVDLFSHARLPGTSASSHFPLLLHLASCPRTPPHVLEELAGLPSDQARRIFDALVANPQASSAALVRALCRVDGDVPDACRVVLHPAFDAAVAYALLVESGQVAATLSAALGVLSRWQSPPERFALFAADWDEREVLSRRSLLWREAFSALG